MQATGQSNTFTLKREFNGHTVEATLEHMDHLDLYGLIVRLDGQLQIIREVDSEPWDTLRGAIEECFAAADDGLGDDDDWPTGEGETA